MAATNKKLDRANQAGYYSKADMKQENISLYYRDRNSDKEYHLTLEAKNIYTNWTGWSVKARYGARGSTLTHVDRSRGRTTSYVEAKKLYDDIVREKKNKGYKLSLNGLNYFDQDRLVFAVESEGFDQAFTTHSAWVDVYNTEFHKLRKEYLQSRNRLAEFLGVYEEVSNKV